MEQVEEIPFSSVVAVLLLKKPEVSCLEIVNFISKISQGEGDIIYDVIEDDCECLSMCVDSIYDGGFKIKNNMSYATILYDNVTVRDYLRGISFKIKDSDVELEDREEHNYCKGNNGVNYYKDHSYEYKNNRNRFEFMPKRRVKTPWMMRRA